MPLSAFNPFRSHSSTPRNTDSQDASDVTPNNSSRSEDQISPPPSFSSSTTNTNPTSSSADSETPRAQPNRDLDGVPLEEPPPYTPRPAADTGETTLEQGPSRPFQPPPPRNPQPPPQQPPRQQPPVISPQSTGWSQPQSFGSPASFGPGPSLGGSSSYTTTSDLVRSFTSSLNHVARNISSNLGSAGVTPQSTGRTQWLSYPGQQAHAPRPYPPPLHPPPGPNSSYFPPPPRHPFSASASTSDLSPPRSPRPQERRHSSDFAREFYAAGTGEGLINVDNEPSYKPPSGPPPSSAPAVSGSSHRREGSIPNDGRPTSHPVVGHPLLKDGKLLVYPKGYKCEKCLNVGYKNADPLHPCKKCWGKYAKPFTGPLAYSFNRLEPGSSSPGSNNFQKPLPRIPPPAPPPIPPLVSFQPPPAHFAPGGYMSNHHGGFYGPPNSLLTPMSPPVPGTVVYPAGDPRIGGRLCWRCNGKGNVSFMVFERMNCEVCGGVGRTFF